MLLSNIPAKLLKAFAAGAGGAFRAALPVNSQIGVQDGRASLTDGFPPLNFQPVASGGVPPFGEDVNGILWQISQWTLWQQAGGAVLFDATFAAVIGGYPKGCILASSATTGLLWLSTADNNSTDPDGGSPANWQAVLPIKSTTPQALAGADDTTFMTPLKTAQALAGAAIPAPPMSLAQNGYVGPIASFGNIIIQWGRQIVFDGGGTITTISFPKPFPGTCYSVIAGGGNDAHQDNNVDVANGTITPGSFGAVYRGGGSCEACFIAIGI